MLDDLGRFTQGEALRETGRIASNPASRKTVELVNDPPAILVYTVA